MQDRAPGYVAGETKRDLEDRGIIVIFWPPFSPDLNPIERVWHIINLYVN
jgi:transposase